METQNNNINDFNELDDLRQQINALKNKVDQEGHLNEELVKKAIQRKMKGVHRTLLWLSILAVAVIPLYILMKYEDGFSWAFTIFTILYLMGFVITDYFINRMDISHMGDDMMETARKLTQMKKNRSRSQRIGIVTSFAWLAWFCYEFYVTHLEVLGNRTALFAIFFIFGVVALVGLASSYLLYRRMQRTNDEMINQINTFMGEK
jgi:membrane protein implicated in regulation of membrane protease activity